jgi:hypothetical protein
MRYSTWGAYARLTGSGITERTLRIERCSSTAWYHQLRRLGSRGPDLPVRLPSLPGRILGWVVSEVQDEGSASLQGGGDRL